MTSRGASRPGSRGPSKASSARAQEAARLAAEQEARRRRDRKLLIVGVVVLVLLIVGGGLGFQSWRANRSPSAATPAVAVTDAPQTLVEGQPIRLGAEAAPVTIALYEDFHCPHCAEFEEELGPVLTTAQNEGTARIDFYPMSFIDPGSTAAANAVACATEAGFGQRYSFGLFANHTLQWSNTQLLELAGKVGATDTGSFSSCVTSGAKLGWVDSINAAAGSNGVTGTPTMFLNGARVDLQGMTPQKLSTMIDDARNAAAK